MINTLELKEGVGVFTPSDKQVGKVSRFVVNPATDEVTHIVVEKGWLFPEDRVIPLDMVSSATDEKVTLHRDVEIDQLPLFEETHYVQAYQNENMSYYYWYPPRGYYPSFGLGYAPWPDTEVTTHNIPENIVLLKEGANVISSDGEYVGDVERLFVEPGWNNRATHFVITQGILFKDRKLIPSYWIRSIEDDQVNLVVTSDFLKDLPSYNDELQQ